MSTFRIDMMRDAIRAVYAVRVPRIIVTAGLTGGPYTLRHNGEESIHLSPDDAREFIRHHPLKLLRILSEHAAEYTTPTQFDGPFPLEPAFPPFAAAPPHA